MSWSKPSKGSGSLKGWGKGWPGGKKNDWHSPGKDWFGKATETTWDESSAPKTGRIWSSKILAKDILRPYADDSGSALYSAGADGVFLTSGLREKFTSDSSEVVRRPAIGVSEQMGSVKALAAVLQEMTSGTAQDGLDKTGISKLHSLFATDSGQEFLQHCEQLMNKTASSLATADIEKSLSKTLGFLHKNRGIILEGAARLAAASSRQYLGSMALLEFLNTFEVPENYADKVLEPEHSGAAEALRKWKKKPTDREALVKFLGQCYEARKQKEAQWSLDRAASTFGDTPWGSTGEEIKKRKKASKQSSSDDSSSEKAKHGRKGRKASKKSPSDESSSESTEKLRRSAKKKPAELAKKREEDEQAKAKDVIKKEKKDKKDKDKKEKAKDRSREASTESDAFGSVPEVRAAIDGWSLTAIKAAKATWDAFAIDAVADVSKNTIEGFAAAMRDVPLSLVTYFNLGVYPDGADARARMMDQVDAFFNEAIKYHE